MFLRDWPPEDRAKVSAVALERAERCQMCGTAAWEWAEDPWAYDPVHHTCLGCQRKEILSADDTPMPKGTTVRLVPKGVAARLALEAERRAEAGESNRPRRRRSEP